VVLIERKGKRTGGLPGSPSKIKWGEKPETVENCIEKKKKKKSPELKVLKLIL